MDDRCEGNASHVVKALERWPGGSAFPPPKSAVKKEGLR